MTKFNEKVDWLYFNTGKIVIGKQIYFSFNSSLFTLLPDTTIVHTVQIAA
jgi:hypothetical protein